MVYFTIVNVFLRKFCRYFNYVNKAAVPDSHWCQISFPNLKNSIFRRINTKISELLTGWLPPSAVAQFCQGVNLKELFADIWVVLSQQVVISYLWSGPTRRSNFHWERSRSCLFGWISPTWDFPFCSKWPRFSSEITGVFHTSYTLQGKGEKLILRVKTQQCYGFIF